MRGTFDWPKLFWLTRRHEQLAGFVEAGMQILAARDKKFRHMQTCDVRDGTQCRGLEAEPRLDLESQCRREKC